MLLIFARSRSLCPIWGLTPWPPTLATWKALACTLKRGGYASTHLYLAAYRTESEPFSRRGCTTSSAAESHRPRSSCCDQPSKRTAGPTDISATSNREKEGPTDISAPSSSRRLLRESGPSDISEHHSLADCAEVVPRTSPRIHLPASCKKQGPMDISAPSSSCQPGEHRKKQGGASSKADCRHWLQI